MRFDVCEREWRDIVVEDKTAGPSDVAATLINFGDWLQWLPRHERRIAQTLATGKTTARQFRVSPGRISQTRRELQQAWEAFQGELAFA